MDLLSPKYLLTVLLVFVRISGLFIAAPFFKQKWIPVQVRVLLAVLLAYTLAGYVPNPPPDYTLHMIGFAAAIFIEAMTGVLLGFAAQFVFYAIDFAGAMMGFQMSLSMAQAYSPVSGTTANPMARFLSLSFLMIFVLLDGHHLVLEGLVRSFQIVPLAGANLEAGGPLLLNWTGKFFTSALQLATPFMVTIFMIDVALGIFARLMPQANLFILGLPLKLMGGIGVAYFFVQYLFPIAPMFIDRMHQHMMAMVRALATV